MRWPSLRWSALREASSQQRYRQPKEVRLLLEPLEDRLLLSTGLAMPLRPRLAEGQSSQSPFLAFFEPSSQSFQPLGGADTATAAVNGTVTLQTSGTFALSLQISGTLGGNAFSLSLSGDVDYDLDLEGEVENGVLDVSSVSLVQSGLLGYTWGENDGTFGLDVTATTGARLDSTHWQRFAWEHIVLDYNPALASATWSSITVTMTGSETVLLNQSGTRDLTGTGTRSLDFGIPGQGGTESYSYDGQLAYTWIVEEVSTFTLTQAGSFAGGSFSLSSTLLERSGTHSFQYAEEGNLSITGSGVRTATDSYSLNQSGGWAGGDFEQSYLDEASGVETYSFGGNLTLSYEELGSGTLDYRESGTFASGAFALGSLTLEQSAEGSFTLNEDQSFWISGTGTRTTSRLSEYDGDTAQGPDTGEGLSNQTVTGLESYSFSRGQQRSLDLSAQASMTLRQQGTATGTAVTLGSFVYEQESTESLTLTALESGTLSGTGSFTSSSTSSGVGGFTSYDGTLGSLGSSSQSSSDSYSLEGESESSYTLTAGQTYSLRQEGSFAGASYALSSVTLGVETEQTLSFYNFESLSFEGSGTRTEGQQGSSLATLSGGANTGSGLASQSYASTSSYTLEGGASSTISGTVAESRTVEQTGAFANGSFAYASLSFDTVQTADYSLSDQRQQTLNGQGLATTISSEAGTGQSFSGANGSLSLSGTNNRSRLSVESFAFTEFSQSTVTLETDATSTFAALGTYGGGVLHLSSLTQDDSGGQTLSYDALQSTLLLAWGSSTSTATRDFSGDLLHDDGSGSSLGTYAAVGGDSYSLTQQNTTTLMLDSTSSFTRHAQGSQHGVNLSLGCVVLDSTSSSSFTLLAQDYLDFSASGSGNSDSSGSSLGTSASSGAYSQTASAGQSWSSTESASYSIDQTSFSQLTLTAGGTETFWGAGQYANGSYALSSLVLTRTDYGTFSLFAWEDTDQSSSGTQQGSGGGENTQAAGGMAMEGSSEDERGSSSSFERLATFSHDSSSLVCLSLSGSQSSSFTAVGSYANREMTLGSFTLAQAQSQSGTILTSATETVTVEEGTSVLSSYTQAGGFDSGFVAGGGSGWRYRNNTSLLSYTSVESATTELSFTGSENSTATGNFSGHSYALSSLSYSSTSGSELSMTATSYLEYGGTTGSGFSGGGDSGQSTTYGGLGTYTSGESFGVDGSVNGAEASTVELRTTETSSQSFLGSYSGGILALGSMVYHGSGTFWLQAGNTAEGAHSGTREGIGSQEFETNGLSGAPASGGSWWSDNRSGNVAESNADEAGSLVSFAWELHQEGSYTGGELNLSSVAYDAEGEQSALGTMAWESTETGDGEREEGGSRGLNFGENPAGTVTENDQFLHNYTVTKDGGYQRSSWSTYNLSQRGTYGDGQYDLGSVVYEARGGSEETWLTDELYYMEGDGLMVATSTGGRGDGASGTYGYDERYSAGSVLETFVRVRTWETEQDGATGSEYLPELSSVTLEATVNESYTFEESKLDGYEGSGFTWSSLETTTGYGSAQATLYQQGDLYGNDWSVASYNYAGSGSSHETLTRATNLNEDVTGPNSVYWSNITTTLEETTERTFGLTEEGTRSAAGTFTFTDYSETGSLSKDSLQTTQSTGLDSWTAEVDPEFPTFPAWGWETWDGERTQHKTVSESSTYEGSGTLDAFSYSEYTHDWTEVSNSTYHKDGDADGSPHPYYTDHTVDTLSSENRQRHTTGSGTAGVTTHTFDWSYSHEDTRWGGLDYDDEDSESSNHTFTLIGPKPTGLLDHPNNVEAHLAIGKNLEGLGLLEGYRGDVKSSSIVPVVAGAVGAADWGEMEADETQVSANGDPAQQGRAGAGGGERAQRATPQLIHDPDARKELGKDYDTHLGWVRAWETNANDAWWRRTRNQGLGSALALGAVEHLPGTNGKPVPGLADGAKNVGDAALGVGHNIVGTAVHIWNTRGGAIIDGALRVAKGAQIAWDTRGGAFVTAGQAAWKAIQDDPSKFFANLGVNLLIGLYTPNLAGSAAKVIAKPIDGLLGQAKGVAQGLGRVIGLGKKPPTAAKPVTVEVPPQAQLNCFPPDTLIATETGLRPIAQVNALDRVWSFDFHTGEWRLCAVECRHDSEYEGYLVTIDFDGGQARATDFHPFWVVRGRDLEQRSTPRHLEPDEDEGQRLAGRWVNSHEIQEGDVLFLRHRGEVVVCKVSLTPQLMKVCNLTVPELHTFAVGTEQALVHNVSGTRDITFDPKKVPHHYEHAKDFGITGSWNKANGAAFQEALRRHVQSASTVIDGTFRGTIPAIHYYDSATGLWVALDPVTKRLLGSWKLSPRQIADLLTNGNIS